MGHWFRLGGKSTYDMTRLDHRCPSKPKAQLLILLVSENFQNVNMYKAPQARDPRSMIFSRESELCRELRLQFCGTLQDNSDNLFNGGGRDIKFFQS